MSFIIDYSDKNNWMKLPEITKDVDAFYVYPTEYDDASEGASTFAGINKNIKDNVAKRIAAYQASY